MDTFKLTLAETQAIITKRTGQDWTLTRLIEAGIRAAVWLEPPPDIAGEKIDATFGPGCRGGFAAPIIYGGDLKRLAFTRGDGTLEMTRRPDGKDLRLDPPARFNADALRFSAESITALVPEIALPGPMEFAPAQSAEIVTLEVTAAAPTKATQAALKMAREDGRLRECEAQGIVFDGDNNLPYGVGAAATKMGLTRQSLSADLKTALRRRVEDARSGKG